MVDRHKQSEQGERLIQVFRDCIENIKLGKQGIRQANFDNLGIQKKVFIAKEDFNPAEKRKVLE